MKTRYLWFILIFLFADGLLFSQKSSGVQTGEIHIKVTGLKNNAGMVALALFKGEKGFPGDASKAWKKDAVKIKNKSAIFILKDIPYGNYAIALFHDENRNFKIDTNFIGIPAEGIGSSNNAKASFGPPKFKDARFIHNGQKTILSINIVYL